MSQELSYCSKSFDFKNLSSAPKTDARTGINLFDERKQDGVVQRFGLQRPQTLDAIHAEPSFLLFIQEDKKRLCSQDEFDCD